MVRRHLRNPVRVELGRQAASAPAEDLLVRQTAYIVPRGHKPAALGRVLDLEAPTATVVFCRTRDEVDQLTETLNGRGYRAEALHGGMDQQHRDRVMSRLRSQTIDLLVATDVAARGLDIDQLTHVVNYDVPSAPESYVHRIGRVGRAGREGTAITLVEPREHRMLKTIERTTRQPITVEKLPTVADLRARRLELVRATLRESLLKDDDLDSFRAVVEPLSEEFDLFEVALAAVRLAHEASGTSHEEEELPEAEWPSADDRNGRRKASRRDEGPPAGRGQRRGRPGDRGHDPPVRGDRPFFRSPAAGSCRRHHRRVVALRPGHRRDRDRRSFLPRRGPRVGRRRRGRGAPAGQHQGPEDNRPPRALSGAVGPGARNRLPFGKGF